jgi:hypothetical protein
MTHRHESTAEVCRGSRKPRLVNGLGNLPPPPAGTRDRGRAGHDQCNERHSQPGHLELRENHEERRVAVLQRDLQGLPDLQEEFANYHYGTPSRELVQQFGEMCLPEKIGVRIRKAESMEMAWKRLNALFKDETAFITDLMQEIRSICMIKDGEGEPLMDYNLQTHIKEACRAGLEEMLLIPANLEEMVRPLPNWESGGSVSDSFTQASWDLWTIVWSTLPTWSQLASDWYFLSRSLCRGHQDRRLRRTKDQENSSWRNARVMATAREDWSADRKNLGFPPPKAWDPEAKWTQDHVMVQECCEKHSLARC